MADYKNILVEKKGKVMIVTINREKALNALNGETIEELKNFFGSYWTDESIGCVILTGSGEKAFVAGADITELANLNSQGGYETSSRGLFLMKTIQNFPRPVIAAVNGFALGGGCELALACDIRLASEKAKFGQPEINLGIIPGYGGTQRLPRLVGRGKAMQLILTAEIIKADEAYRIGLVDEIYPPEELMDKAIALAELISSKPPIGVMLAKKSVHRGLEGSLALGCDLEKSNFAHTCSTEDKTEGMAAFLEKRQPVFKGK